MSTTFLLAADFVFIVSTQIARILIEDFLTVSGTESKFHILDVKSQILGSRQEENLNLLVSVCLVGRLQLRCLELFIQFVPETDKISFLSILDR